MRSLQTHNTAISKAETENFAFYDYGDEHVAVRKWKVKPPLRSRDTVELRFVGASNRRLKAAFRL